VAKELDKYPLMYEVVPPDLEIDPDPLFNEPTRYVPMCEAMDPQNKECPNKATIEWFRHGAEDYFYTLRCDEHPPAESQLYEAKEL
jgi:hypothetical protein